MGKYERKRYGSSLACPVAAGRRSHPENSAHPADPIRDPFQHDRDRIVHCKAFRRLTGKTQAFLPDEGDHFRNRLTHSLEVSQIARTLARWFHANEDLTEAIALAHDLGHPPFGHAGERALDTLMAGHGGFDHNVQGLRLVRRLETGTPAGRGLNLTWPTLEGIAKHNGPVPRRILETNRESGRAYRRLSAEIPPEFSLQREGGIEAQCAAIADDIAWVSHDVDDGIRSALLDTDELMQLAIVRRLQNASPRMPTDPASASAMFSPQHPAPSTQLGSRLIDLQVRQAIAHAETILAAEPIRNTADVRARQGPVVAFSTGFQDDIDELKRYLHANLYTHATIVENAAVANNIIVTLFRHHEAHTRCGNPAARATDVRQVCDFIAGMTDRYALERFEHVTGRSAGFAKVALGNPPVP